MLSKDKLVFSETDIAGSDQVGAHILGSSGVKITSTTNGAKQELDVKDAATIAALATIDADIVSTNTKLDTQITKLTSIDGKVATAANQASQITLLTSLDGKDYATQATLAGIKTKTDQFTFNAGRLEVVADIRLESDIADNAVDSENPLKMGSRALDGALSAVSASGNKANVISDMYRRVYVNTAPNVGSKVTAASVTATASQLVATPLAGRVNIMIQNLGTKSIFIGFSGSVTVANGLRVSVGAFLEMPFGKDLPIFAISESGTQDVRIVEIA